MEFHGFAFYPVHCAKLTLIQTTWSAYPYHLVFLIWHPYSLVFLIWYPYALISLYGNTAHCPKEHYCHVTMIWPLLFHGIRADADETPDNASTTRMHGDYRLLIDRFFVGFNAICYAFLINNPIYIEGRNCRLTGLVQSLGYSINATSCAHRQAILWKIIGFIISKLYYRCVNYIFVLDKGLLRGYAIRSGRRHEGSQWPPGGPQIFLLDTLADILTSYWILFCYALERFVYNINLCYVVWLNDLFV